MKNIFAKRLITLFSEWATPTDFNSGNWRFKNKLLNICGLEVGKHSAIGPGFQWIRGLEKNIAIDCYVAIGHNAHLWCFNRIEIGRFTTIAADVSMTNGWHSVENMQADSGKLKIGRGCWIGMGAKLIGNISIGDNAVIGAGSTVIRDVAAGDIVAGTPARILRKRPISPVMTFFGNIKYSPNTFQIVNENSSIH